MSPLDSRCLEHFPAWLRTLPADAGTLCELLEGAASEPLKASAASALNYLFKSIDLIPDGLEDLGYLDDAFVFRVALARAASEGGAPEAGSDAARLVADAELIREFLGDDFERLEGYVARLAERPVRERSVNDLLSDADKRAEVVREVQGWASSFEPPVFLRDAKSLVKLRSFLSARLRESS